MYSIENNIDNTIIIKKSKFITKLYKINNIDEIKNILESLKKEYKDATHICYAYIINGIEKCSDDGEPSKTAGMPILNILKKRNLNCILAIVIRYFGGIKLGANGLIHAYSDSIIEALNLTNIIELIDGYDVTIKFDYNNIKEIDSILKNIDIYDKEFNELINYYIYISKEKYNEIENKLNMLCSDIVIKRNILIKK